MSIKAKADDIQAQMQSLSPKDPMAEAARTTLLVELVRILKRIDHIFSDDIEELHRARVSTRRLRSLLTLYSPYFQQKPVARYQKYLRRFGKRLGAVRDLDVLLENMKSVAAELDADKRDAFQSVIEILQTNRKKQQKKLRKFLDKPDFERFVDTFGTFVTRPGYQVIAVETDQPVPYELRHILPIVIADQLAKVRAYDSALEEANVETLHALRIEFKELRYLISAFESVLGKTISNFLEDVKQSQEALGRLNDIRVAMDTLASISADNLSDEQQQAIEAYVADLLHEEETLTQNYRDTWQQFNARKSQKHLSDAILTLR